MNSRTAAYWPSAARSIARGLAAEVQPLQARTGWLGSGGAGRPGTGYSCSPETCSTARLVTIALISGAARSRSATIGAGRDDLLEVVEDQQQPLVARASRPATRRSVARSLSATPRALAIRGATSIGSRIGSRATKKTPSGKSSEARGRELERQPGLAGPARAGQRQQPGRGQQAGRLLELGVAPDERRQLGRQVVRPGVERPERREVGRQAVGDDLDDAHRRAQVLEPVLAEVAQRDAVDRAVHEQVAGQAGRQDLAAVGDAPRSAPPG